MTLVLNHFARTALEGFMMLACVLGPSVCRAGPVGRPGTGATYQIAADLHERPAHEREHKLSIVELTVTIGPTEPRENRTCQWVILSMKRLSGEMFTLWLLLDRLPGAGMPTVARYIWSEPQWDKPLEYINVNTGAALLPRMGLWSRGWPQGLGGTIKEPGDFPERVQYLGYPFTRIETRPNASIPVPETKLLRLNPDWMVYTVDAYHYDAPPLWRLPEEQVPLRHGPRHYHLLTRKDVRQYMDLGVNVLKSSHLKFIDLWQEPVFVYKDATWPQVLYRSNYYCYKQHLNEPTALFGVIELRKKGKAVSTWTPARLAELVEARTREAINDRSARIWRVLQQTFGLGDLPAYRDPICAWDAMDAAWYVMAADTGGLVVEGPGLFRHARTLPYMNMTYRARIPHTQRNRAALATAILRGAARNFNKEWGISLYETTKWSPFLADMDYAYQHGAHHLWMWAGWPNDPPAPSGRNVGSEIPHPYKLAVFEEVQNIARRHGPRDMDKLLHLAKVAVVLPHGYTMGLSGSIIDMNGDWMHAETENEQGVKIGDVLHNAYIEAERLLRGGIEFDIVVDHRLKKTGYGQYIYIQEDGRVRVEHGAEVRLLDGPRTPRRPDLGAEPTIAAEFLRRPIHPGDRLEIAVTIRTGSGDVAVPLDERYLGQKRYWRVGAGRLHFPDGHARPFFLELAEADPTGSVLRSNWTADDLEETGNYRIWLATIDEFARPAQTWLEFGLRGK